jgi:zinc transport system substrate-binding protein
MRTLFRWAVVVLALGGVHGGEGAEGGRLKVVATIAPLYCFAANVAGGHADVAMLLPPGRGPHDFSLSPSDMQLLLEADVVVMNGLGLESWLDPAIAAVGRKDLVRVDTGASLEIPEVPAAGDVLGVGHEHGGGDACRSHAHGNPHIWLDPVLAAGQVEAIARALEAADPANAGAYRANAGAYLARLRVLDEEIRAALSALPDKRIITYHDAFPYFAARYGITVAGVFQGFPGKDPTPKQIARLRDLIQKEGVRGVFAEPQFSPRLITSMAADLGIPAGVLDPMGTGRASPDFYEEVALANRDALVKALGDGR